MQKRHLPTAFRKPGQGLTNLSFALARSDLDNLTEIRTAFERAHGVIASASILLGLALTALLDEVRAGKVCWSDDLRSTVKEARR